MNITNTFYDIERIATIQVRLQIQIPACYQQEPIISQLIATYGLAVNITGAILGKQTNGCGYFDLELRGTHLQINRGLDYLRSLQIKVIGKPNPAGDSWSY